MISRRNQIILLAVLALLFAFVLYLNRRPARVAAVSGREETFKPLAVENPTLRMDLLVQLKKLEYRGSHRNIFSAAPPPPAPSALPSVKASIPQLPPGPPPIPPLTVPAKFFGHVTDARTGVRRAFFSEGDDVYVLAVGDLLLGRFRLLQIGNSTAELEETSSGRRTTLVMEEPGPS